jgi:mono/diheme cytochrome c family protein
VVAAASTAPADPLLAQGKLIFEGQACTACHGDKGEGTAAGSKLVGIGAKVSPEQLAALLRQPTDKMKAGGMTPPTLSDEEMKALVSYLSSLK